MMDLERRIFAGALEVRATDGAPPMLRGHAAVFNTDSEELGFLGKRFVERIAPGAFAGTLNQDVRALFNHDPNYVLGRTTSNTLRLNEDQTGLATEIDPPETRWAQDLLVSIGRGDVSQMSFGFRIADGGDTWEKRGDVMLRTITKVAQLADVSPVTYPAYPDTKVAVRSLEQAIEAAAARGELTGRSLDFAARVLRDRAHR